MTLPEELGNGIARQWLCDQQIVAYRFGSGTRVAVDTWFDAVVTDMLVWPSDKIFLALHDLRGAAMTPYGVFRAKELARLFRPELHGYYASVIENGPVGIAIRFFGMSSYKKMFPKIQSGWFFDYDVALNWLSRSLPKPAP